MEPGHGSGLAEQWVSTYCSRMYEDWKMRRHIAVSDEGFGPGSVTGSVRASIPAETQENGPSPDPSPCHLLPGCKHTPEHSLCSEPPTVHGLDSSADTVPVPSGSVVCVGSVPGLVTDNTSSGDGKTEPPKLCQPGSWPWGKRY